jgi:hypothetical protein
MPSWGYGVSVWGPNDEMSFQIGVVNLAVVLLALFLARRSKLWFWSVLVFGAAVFLMNSRSGFLWEKIPWLSYFQFPWRFLLLTTLVTPILFSLLKRKWLKIGLLIFAFILTINYFRPERVFPERNDESFLRRYVANDSWEYAQNTEEYLRLPVGVEKRPTSLVGSKVTAERGKLQFEQKSMVSYAGTIQLNEPGVVYLRQYYFPGWQAALDGKKTEIRTIKPWGIMAIDLPAGGHTFDFWWGRTPVRMAAEMVSLLSLVGLLFLW